MKTYVEIGLAALLAVLVYEKPAFLVNIANSTLGKIIMIIIVGVVAKQFGINAGLLAAVIMILLQESHREGLTNNDGGCNQTAWNKGKAPAGCAVNMEFAGPDKSPIGGACSQDIDCKPGKRTCQNTKNDSGTPKECATKSTCVGGKCEVQCQEGECPGDSGGALSQQAQAAIVADKQHEQGSDEQFVGGMREGYTSTRIPLRPSSFPVTGTDQIGLSRMLKVNALHAKMAASQQANGCTNNGGGIAF